MLDHFPSFPSGNARSWMMSRPHILSLSSSIWAKSGLGIVIARKRVSERLLGSSAGWLADKATYKNGETFPNETEKERVRKKQRGKWRSWLITHILNGQYVRPTIFQHLYDAWNNFFTMSWRSSICSCIPCNHEPKTLHLVPFVTSRF